MFCVWPGTEPPPSHRTSTGCPEQPSPTLLPTVTMAPEEDAKWGWHNPSCRAEERGRAGVTRHGTRLWCEEISGRWRWRTPPQGKEPCVDEGAWDVSGKARSYVCRDGSWREEGFKDRGAPSPSDWPRQGPGKVPNPMG